MPYSTEYLVMTRKPSEFRSKAHSVYDSEGMARHVIRFMKRRKPDTIFWIQSIKIDDDTGCEILGDLT